MNPYLSEALQHCSGVVAVQPVLLLPVRLETTSLRLGLIPLDTGLILWQGGLSQSALGPFHSQVCSTLPAVQLILMTCLQSPLCRLSLQL